MDTNQTHSPASADLIIKHVWIVTMDEERRIFRDGAIAVKGDRITGVGPSPDILQNFRADTVIDGTDVQSVPLIPLNLLTVVSGGVFKTL